MALRNIQVVQFQLHHTLEDKHTLVDKQRELRIHIHILLLPIPSQIFFHPRLHLPIVLLFQQIQLLDQQNLAQRIQHALNFACGFSVLVLEYFVLEVLVPSFSVLVLFVQPSSGHLLQVQALELLLVMVLTSALEPEF
jgi:hypothetical protein